MCNYDRQESTLIFVGQLVNELLASMEPEGHHRVQNVLKDYFVLNQFNN
jgi:hypothetical protein